jgi:hypothetical protein
MGRYVGRAHLMVALDVATKTCYGKPASFVPNTDEKI